MEINWTIKRFDDLSIRELYELLRLRVDVFVVEQECPYPELDNKDSYSTHVLGLDTEGKIAAYARIVDPGISHELPAIGRVVTDPQYRGSGLGHEVMRVAMKACESAFGKGSVWLSAQDHLRGYYNKHGFTTISDTYVWDGIPHIDMRYDPGNPVPVIEDLLQSRRSFFASRWEDFESARNGLLGYLKEWSPEMLSKQPEEGSWSALQVLDHILVSEKGTLSYMLKKTQAESGELPLLEKDDRYKAQKLLRRLASMERYTAPEALPPPGENKTFAQMDEEWAELRAQYNQFLSTLQPGYYGRMIFRHPFSGPMSVEETLGFLIEHIRHHMHQLRRIQQALEPA